MKQHGFTLIELLIVASVVSLLGVVFSQTLLSLISGSGKSDVTSDVKQNGEYALEFMVPVIRNAKSVDWSNCSASSLKIINSDDTTTTFSCTNNQLFWGNTNSSLTPTPTAALTISGIQVTSCAVFTCLAPTPPNMGGVGIQFTLTKATNGVGSSRASEQSSQSFQTTVYLRNYNF